MKSQFYIISIILIVLAISVIVTLLSIPSQLSPLSLSEIEKVSSDIIFLKNFIMNLKKEIARDWLSPFFSMRDVIEIKNNEYDRKEWIVRAFYDFPDDVDMYSIRIGRSEEIPSQVKWINIQNKTGEITFIDNFAPYETKKYFIYYTKASEYTIGKGDYRNLVSAFENSSHITIETIRYKVVLNKSRGGAIDELYIKPNLTKNFVYNIGNWSFQSLFNCSGNIYSQSGSTNITIELIENGPLFVLLKVVGRHGNGSIPGFFTQYQYYYPDYVIISEELNLTQNYVCGSLYYGYMLAINSSIVSLYNDGNSNGNSDNPNISPNGWMDFYSSDNYFGISQVFENRSQFVSFGLYTAAGSMIRYFISRVWDTPTMPANVYRFNVLIYPHFGNYQSAGQFYNLTNSSLVLTRLRTEELSEKLKGLTNIVQSLNLEKGLHSFFTTDKEKRVEVYNGQNDWVNTSLNKRIGFHLKSNYLMRLFPAEIDVQFTKDVNPNSILVTTKGGDFIRSQVSTDNYYEDSYFNINLTNPTAGSISYVFYTYNLDGRNFNITVFFSGSVTMSVYYPNNTCTNICNAAVTNGNPVLINANLIAGSYKIITVLTSGTNMSIKSTLPKLVLANQSFYIRGNSNGSLIIYVPKSNTSTVNFNVTLNCSSSSNCYQTNISDENEIEIASSYVNNSGKKLVVNVVNKDDGSFYKLSFYNFIPVSYLYVQLSGTSPYTSPNKLYWMDIDAPILKLILQKNFESDVDMIYVYYSNNSAISVAKPTFNLQLTNYILVNDYFYWKFLANAFYIKPGVD